MSGRSTWETRRCFHTQNLNQLSEEPRELRDERLWYRWWGFIYREILTGWWGRISCCFMGTSLAATQMRVIQRLWSKSQDVYLSCLNKRDYSLHWMTAHPTEVIHIDPELVGGVCILVLMHRGESCRKCIMHQKCVTVVDEDNHDGPSCIF